jgi:translation initiation factor IF-2
MSESGKEKKIRIHNLAIECNVSSDTLIEFLVQKGHTVKNLNSLVTEAMMVDVQAHFKKDIEKAEIHHKKITAYQKKKSDQAVDEPRKIEPEVKVPTPAEVVEEKTEVKKAEKTTAEQIPSEEKTFKEKTKEAEEEKEEAQPSEVSVTEKVPEVAVAEEPVQSVETEHENAEPEKDEKITSFKTKAEIEIEEKKKGLKIVGKIELGRKKKKDTETKSETIKQPSEIEEDKPKETDKTFIETVKKVDEVLTDEEKAKKKKKLKAKKKADGSVEEQVKVKKLKKLKKQEVDKREVEAAIKRTIISMEETVLSDRAALRKKKKQQKLEQQEKIQEQIQIEKSKLKITEYMAVNEIANLMNVPVAEVIQKCIGLGLMVSINQRLDVETLTLVADEFGFQVEVETEFSLDSIEDHEDKPEDLLPRPPVVTIMGHVDHGKTSLLDYIRKSNVVAGESGGITQHIGAYQVDLGDGKLITFLDTPGHEAFTAMRARGAKVTDIVILIVAADDAVMPQTVEAINHALAASVPIIVAINKIDKPNTNIDKIKQQLADRNVLVEDWGGRYQCVEISAKKGINIDLLLEKILLEAEVLELKANPNRNARGTIIETKMEQGRGILATILVEKGTLKVGDPFVAGIYHGRVRAMFDERNKRMNSAGPATPVVVSGFEGSPQAGDSFVVMNSEREAREISIKRMQIKREQDNRQVRLITLDQIAQQINSGGIKELPIIVKGDVDGSVEALSDSLMKLSNSEVSVNVIHKAVGAINEGDVLLASASNAIIIGFHVRPNANARKLSETEKIDIRLYNVIYDAINEVKSALEGMLSPVISEEQVANLEIRETFKVPKVGTIAGCYVQSGKITRQDKIRLIRDGIVIYEGNLASLKRFKDDVREVDAGYECGLNIANFNDVKVGDIIEAYKIIETKKKLSN